MSDGDVLVLGAVLLIGALILVAATSKPCPNCHALNPNNASRCRTCGYNY